MTGLLFTGGEGPSPSDTVLDLIRGADLVAAADSGILLAREFGISPDYILGDMDSLENAEDILKSYPEERILRFGREKDYTDTELGLSFLSEKGCGRIIIAGGSGGRTDHFVGILCLFFRDVHPDIWIMKNETAMSVEGSFSLETRSGEIISLFPVSGEECRMKSTGLKWKLDNLAWKTGDAGISNVALGSRIEIEMRSGRLLLIRKRV